MDALGRLLLTSAAFWLISVYVLYGVVKHLRFRKQDKWTAVVTGIAGLALGVFVFSLFPGDGIRFIALAAYVVLVKAFYGSGWGASLDAVVRTAFLSVLLVLPIILLIERLLV